MNTELNIKIQVYIDKLKIIQHILDERTEENAKPIISTILNIDLDYLKKLI